MPRASSRSTAPAPRRWLARGRCRPCLRHAVAKGAEPLRRAGQDAGRAGDRRHRRQLIYFIDQLWRGQPLQRRVRLARRAKPRGRGLLLPRPPDPQRPQGQHGQVVRFYGDIFNFREIRFFDIEGKFTGLLRAR
jgi:4-hydroxyphenylpyruvate dioxygenase